MALPRCLICDNAKLIDLKELNSKLFVDHWQKYFKINVADFFSDHTFFLKKCPECSLEFYFPAIPADSKIYDQLQDSNWYYESDKDEFSYAIDTIIKFKMLKLFLMLDAAKDCF